MSAHSERRWLLLAAVLMACVFAAYLRPGFIVDLSNQLWLCTQ